MIAMRKAFVDGRQNDNLDSGVFTEDLWRVKHLSGLLVIGASSYDITNLAGLVTY